MENEKKWESEGHEEGKTEKTREKWNNKRGRWNYEKSNRLMGGRSWIVEEESGRYECGSGVTRRGRSRESERRQDKGSAVRMKRLTKEVSAATSRRRY